MVIEHDIMWQIMRIGASTRRRLPHPSGRRKLPIPGFGHILDLLAENNGMSQQQIAEALHIRPQSVSEAIKGMENQGFVRRQPNEQDRRSSLIFITQLGLERRVTAEKERIARAREILSCLSDEEKVTLYTILHKVTDEIKKKDEVV